MKILLQIVMLLSLMSCIRAEKSSYQGLRMKNNMLAFDFNTFSASEANDNFGEMSNRIKIVYYEDYVLYEITVLETKTELDGNGEEVIKLDPLTKRKSYRYYIVKKGQKNGMMFYSLEKYKVFAYQNFIKAMGMNFEDYSFFNLNLGDPKKIEIDSKRKLSIQKFAPPVKTIDDPDSIFCFYDSSLKGIDFSFNPAIDKRSNSKLWKIAMIFNAKQKPIVQPAYQIYWEFKRSNKVDEKKYLIYFQKYISTQQNNSTVDE